MIVKSEQFKAGIYNYIENEIAKKATGLKQFMIYFATPTIVKKINTMIDSLVKDETVKEYIDDNGNINLDLVYTQAKGAMQKSGKIEAYGIIFDDTDIDKLYNYIRQAPSN
jgi:hypothetical protein